MVSTRKRWKRLRRARRGVLCGRNRYYDDARERFKLFPPNSDRVRRVLRRLSERRVFRECLAALLLLYTTRSNDVEIKNVLFSAFGIVRLSRTTWLYNIYMYTGCYFFGKKTNDLIQFKTPFFLNCWTEKYSSNESMTFDMSTNDGRKENIKCETWFFKSIPFFKTLF